MKWWRVEGSLELGEVDEDKKDDGLENVLIAPCQAECEELGELWKGTLFCTVGNDEKCWVVDDGDGTEEWNVIDWEGGGNECELKGFWNVFVGLKLL